MNKKSFTLIEILVVIVIVGILSGFVLIISNSVTDSANDAKRKNDINSLQKVILAYKTLYGLAPQEADECEIGNDCSNLQNSLISADYYSSTGSMPRDPDGTYYTYESDDGTDFTLKGDLSNSYVYQYQYSVGFSEALPSEERVTNGGLETGNLNGWTSSGVTVTSSNPHSGIYCADMYIGDGPEPSNSFYQSVNFDDVNNLSFYWKGDAGNGEGAVLAVKIGSNTIWSTSGSQASWTLVSIDVSSYSGTQTLGFYYSAEFQIGNADLYFDDISATTN